VSADRAAAPSGVVTFLFTDVEGSTRRWEADADSMRSALSAHDEVLRGAIDAARRLQTWPRAGAVVERVPDERHGISVGRRGCR
jgi:class 3 adenylate cyclase